MRRKRIRDLKKQGTLFVHPDGYGFVNTDMPKDAFIPAKHLNGAIHGDLVMINMSTRDGKLYEGRVLKILERSMKYIVGTAVKKRGQFFCKPLDKHIIVALPFEKGTKELKQDEVVKCEMISDKRGNLKVRLYDKLGDENVPDIDTKLVIHKHNLPVVFSRETSAQVLLLKHGISASERAGRRDITNIPIVTIDGDDARDFDDAVFVKKTSRGYTLYVSIADVSHYVKKGAPIDIDAYDRGTSVYFPDKAIPMLPEELSNDLCSLKPDEERLTVTAEIMFDKRGNRIDYAIYPSVIKSSARLTYAFVKELLENKHREVRANHNLIKNLQVMKELALMMNKHRIKNGSLDFDLPDIELTLDNYGDPKSIAKKERNIAHIIIEEFMLEANRVVATHCTSDKYPFIYRIHEQPDNDKLYEFYLFTYNLGLKMPAFKNINSTSLKNVLDQVKDDKLKKVVYYALLRSMKQAKYSTQNIGHYGLAFDLYTHFTSPIRRYPDLTVHRILKDVLGRGMSKKRVEMWASGLEDIAKHSSETERKAMDAERDLVKILTAKMLIKKQNSPMRGYISGITGSGIFAEIEDFFIDGFLAFEDIKGDYFYTDTKRFVAVGKKTGRTFKIGQKLNIKITHIERFTGDIKLELVSASKK